MLSEIVDPLNLAVTASYIAGLMWVFYGIDHLLDWMFRWLI